MLPCTHTIPSLSTQVTKDSNVNQNGVFADNRDIVGIRVHHEDGHDEHDGHADGHDDLNSGERGGGDEQL